MKSLSFSIIKFVLESFAMQNVIDDFSSPAVSAMAA